MQIILRLSTQQHLGFIRFTNETNVAQLSNSSLIYTTNNTPHFSSHAEILTSHGASNRCTKQCIGVFTVQTSNTAPLDSQ